MTRATFSTALSARPRAARRAARSVAIPLLVAAVLLVLACDRPATPTGASERAVVAVADARTSAADATVQASGRDKVAICHRADGKYVPITVAEPAVDAHLAHGDARVGDAVPGQEGMILDASCAAVPAGGTIVIGGFFDGRVSWVSGGFTLAAAGPVHAGVTVTSGYELPMPLHLELLGFNPTVTARERCSAQWLPAALPAGPSMSAPTLTGHWDAVPPGSYCVNVAGENVPPFNWSGSVTY